MSVVGDRVYVCVCLRLRRDGNPSAFASQLQSWPVKRDYPWCQEPNMGNLNQADTLLAQPAPAPNCSWQYQMHPIGHSTVVQFPLTSHSLLLSPVQILGQREEKGLLFKTRLVQHTVISSILKRRKVWVLQLETDLKSVKQCLSATTTQLITKRESGGAFKWKHCLLRFTDSRKRCQFQPLCLTSTLHTRYLRGVLILKPSISSSADCGTSSLGEKKRQRKRCQTISHTLLSLERLVYCSDLDTLGVFDKIRCTLVILWRCTNVRM